MLDPKILIVDDDEDLQVLYGLFLQGESFSIAKAYDGKQALEQMERERPDLIVLDMIMPVMDGEEFLEQLSSEGRANGIPIIIASVNDKIPPRLFEKANVCATLKKPFTIETLVGKIRDALNLKS